MRLRLNLGQKDGSKSSVKGDVSRISHVFKLKRKSRGRESEDPYF